ncbi:MAG: SRPBCC domain-containing protein [Bacteroidota bacterium]
MNQQDNTLHIKRVVHAPRELVFDAFTKAEHLMHWWGPEGCTLTVLNLNVKPGGKFHYKMSMPGGQEMYGVFNYKEIKAPEKIVFTNSFADEKGNIIATTMLENFPKEILNTWIFTEENGVTTLNLSGTPLSDIASEISTFAGMKENMGLGFGKTFDQLDAYIKSQLKIKQQLKTTTMARVSTYLNFPGNTEEAFNFYRSVFGGEFSGKGIQRFGDIPATAEHPPISEEVKKMILHVELSILGGHIIMATDAPESMGFTLNSGNNTHINLEPDSKEETTRLFNALSSGGNITMPLQDMFFGAYYGSCTDKYGVNWMFNFTTK